VATFGAPKFKKDDLPFSGGKIVPRRIAKIGILAVGTGLLLPGVWHWSSRCRAMSQSKSMEHIQSSTTRPQHTNRLIHEKSPYLLLHAHNPVDWFPWGEEAFEKARREQKPIFLSVGYATCHWCHVMERESFSDAGIAEIMNQHFVSIKVDREERPDVDRIYMAFVQATTGQGGWPMSVFLTPDLKPFLGGTYFPPQDRGGHAGFRTILLRVAQAWDKNREQIIGSANQVTQALREFTVAEKGSDGRLGEGVLDRTFARFESTYDPIEGGFGTAPKFPRPVVFNFLLRDYARTGRKPALEMTLHTLRAMARGGIHDHLGGGFHRYSTDRAWHVPHFEKMLYDQAQLAVSYVQAYQITHNPLYARTARDILDYVLRDMRSPEGGFFSAEDADSQIEAGRPEHGEGAFYVWKAAEIQEALDEPAAAVFDFYYGVEPSGNVPLNSDPFGEFEGKNILVVRRSVEETAGHFAKPAEEIETILAKGRGKLLAVRSRRPRPPLDDKILTAWNGLMISALSEAGQVLDEPRYLTAAQSAAEFLRAKLYDAKEGKLLRRYRDGEADIDGFLDDYAFLIQGLLDLYESSFDVQWLAWAAQLQETQDRLFWDEDSGAYFSTTGDDPSILIRMRDDYDGAEPSGNSVAAMNLLRLSQMTGRSIWRKHAERLFAAFGKRLESNPETLPQLAVALDFSMAKSRQIVIAGEPGAPDTRALLRLVRERFLPNKVVFLADGAKGQEQLAHWLPFLHGVTRLEGRATAYVCEDYVCKLPTSDPKVVARLLDGKS
jgi:uncharacterized protein YyaL (SSP411 family)